ncbi:MAG: 3-deoxy-7-phosphoheptulonate synthase [Lentisphaerae bacterium]|nr:3-deoxy-7-phosphoheptulonate synthase [Lentisphaerota bacterium]
MNILQKSSDVNILSRSKLPTPGEIHSELPLALDKVAQVLRHRQEVFDILDGKDKRRMIVVGPCSLHDHNSALEYADKLAKLNSEVSDKLMLIMRVYFEKPRTTVGWKGLIYDPDMNGAYNIDKGIRSARRLMLEIVDKGLPVATETLDPILVQYIIDAVAWTAIGARTTESQPHRQLASGLSMAVGFKNATDGNMQIAIDAVNTARRQHSFIGVDENGEVSVYRTAGNNYGHIVLRGGAGPNYGAEHIAFLKVAMRKAKLQPQIVIDCSHANSGKRFDRQKKVFYDVLDQIVAGEDAIKGLMLESHLCEGHQDLVEGRNPLPNISVTDGCIGWQETEELIRLAYSKL